MTYGGMTRPPLTGLPTRPCPLGADVAETVRSLRWHWGSAYEITARGRQAERRDGQGTLTARSPDELLAEIRKDYRARPVPRDLPKAG